MEWKDGQFKISNDKALISTDRVCYLLSSSYWASKRSKEVIEKSIENSICYGVYIDEMQIGFGRIVTDYATMFYICDVIIDEKYRGQGLGKKLIECMIEFEDFSCTLGMLLTKDAHGLYEHYGFTKEKEKFMVRLPQINR